MTTGSKQLVKFLIRIIITTGLLVWVFSRIDLQQFWQTVKTTRWQFLIAVWGLTVIMFWINSIKMKLILKKQGCNVSIATIFGASAITLLYGLIIPGVLSAGVKWYILRKDTGKGSNVLSSMLYNQLSTMFVMAVFGLVALIVTNPPINTANPWLLPALCSILLAGIILVSLLLLSSRTGGRIINGLRLLLRPFPANVRQKGQEIIEQIAIFQTVGGGFHLTMLSITIIAIILGGVCTYILSARGANITAPLGVLVWLCAIVSFLGRLPISIANLGVREATLVGFLALYGVETSPALLMSMILFSSVIFMAVIGAIYQLYWAVTAKKPKS
jgi:uncharacterized membrane protein YbhN (UPF0104 family)